MKPPFIYALIAIFVVSIGGYAYVMHQASSTPIDGHAGHHHAHHAFTGMAIPLNVLSPQPAPASTKVFEPAQAGESITWETDLTVAMQKAKAADTLIFVDFYTDWCAPCQQMDKETFVDATTIGASKSFVFLKIDCDKQPSVAKQYEVTGYPTVMVLNSEGSPVQVGQGYQSAKQVTAMLGQAHAAQDKLNTVRATAKAQPDNFEAQLALADNLLRMDQATESKQISDALTRRTDLTPAQQDALALLAIKHDIAKIPTGSEQGLVALSEFIKSNPASPAVEEANKMKARIYMVEAYHLVRHGQRGDALARLDALIKSYPESQEGKWANMMHQQLAGNGGHHGHNH